MKLRLATPLTMLVSFTLTLGFLLWDRRGRDFAPLGNAGIAQRNRPPEIYRMPPGASLTAWSSPPGLREASPATLNGIPPAGSGDHAKLKLPVQLHFRRAPNSQTYVATVINKGEEDLMIDIAIFSPTSQRTAQTQISIESMQVKKIGLDDDIDMAQGDRITLHNSSYDDFVAEIRAP